MPGVRAHLQPQRERRVTRIGNAPGQREVVQDQESKQEHGDDDHGSKYLTKDILPPVAEMPPLVDFLPRVVSPW
jgi:hypothetical protein